MGNTDANRVFFPEQISTFTSMYLDDLIREMDRRFNAANCFLTITRDVEGLISKTEYFKDIARTQKGIERNFVRTLGFGGVKYITSITSIYYNSDTSEDSRVVTTITRDTPANKSVILSCDSVFSTGEDVGCYL